MSGPVRAWIEYSAEAIEILAVAIMITLILVGTVRWLSRAMREGAGEYRRYRVTLGSSLLVGLELLVAADIVRTVTLDPTLEGIAGLGALIAVRTVLSWTLSLEVEGRWPWQPASPGEGRAADEPAVSASRRPSPSSQPVADPP